MITQAVQDYLKVIFKLGRSGDPVSTTAIAGRLGVSQASVTGMVKKLSELKLIRHKPYHGVALTEAGRKVALEIIRHHRLLELYLAEAIGYSWDEVHEEAEKLEHHISEEFEEKMARVLGNPEFDPHGAPIPTKEGALTERRLQPLTLAGSGRRVHIRQVSDRDPEMLRYLGSLGIYPDSELEVLTKAPFGGPLHIRINGVDHHLSEMLTNEIYISVEC